MPITTDLDGASTLIASVLPVGASQRGLRFGKPFDRNIRLNFENIAFTTDIIAYLKNGEPTQIAPQRC